MKASPDAADSDANGDEEEECAQAMVAIEKNASRDGEGNIGVSRGKGSRIDAETVCDRSDEIVMSDEWAWTIPEEADDDI